MAFSEFQSLYYSMVMALSVEADTCRKLRLRTSWRMLDIQTEDYEITFFTSISCLGLQPNHWHSNNVHSTDTDTLGKVSSSKKNKQVYVNHHIC